MHDTTIAGIEYITNDHGKKVAVQLDLKEHGDLWEDVYLSLVAGQRMKEPTVSYQTVRKKLVKKGKLPK